MVWSHFRSQFFYSCGRNSVLWNVSAGAKDGKPTERTRVLAEPKHTHRDFKDHRLVYCPLRVVL